MVIYLCKGYVIFSFLKSRWSDNTKKFTSRWKEAANTGIKRTVGVGMALMRLARTGSDVKTKTREYGVNTE